MKHKIRSALAESGIDFSRLSWHETQNIVDAAIKPFRDEIKRLRELATRDNSERREG